jgi:hypothetical protein
MGGPRANVLGVVIHENYAGSVDGGKCDNTGAGLGGDGCDAQGEEWRNGECDERVERLWKEER